jgi:DNA mismatch endonuclease (patch repair protein)
MADRVTPQQRSRMMASVRNRDTQPELTVRRIAHALGYRFRLHVRDLPGHPDLVFPKYRAVLFVHGCFWHGHEGCKRSQMPTTNVAFWRAKLLRNRDRDESVAQRLAVIGWRIGVIWECEATSRTRVERCLLQLLGMR